MNIQRRLKETPSVVMFSIFTRARLRTASLRLKPNVYVCAREFKLYVCEGFPRQAYGRLPTTPTVDVANNRAINAAGMWKRGDVLRADNGNAWHGGYKDVKRNELHPDGRLSDSMRFLPR